MTDQKILKDMLSAISEKEKATSPYDATAEVVRVDESTAWVHFPGGVDETPAAMTVNAKPGDKVRVRVAGGQAWLTGSDTAPPTDDRTANTARAEAGAAQETADTALKDAARAAEAADVAETAAVSAQTSATAASNAAGQAVTQAQTATTAANNALTQLSTVEDVVGTLNWIAEHGTYAATSDAAVIPGKMYFTRSGSGTTADPYVYALVTEPASDPATAGYYELTGVDEAVANYVGTHLALLDDGLYIILDSSGYKLRLTNTGANILDQNGNPVATYALESTIGDETERHVHVGTNSVDICDGVDVLASFGETVTVGDSAASHIDISEGRISFKIGLNEVAYIAIDNDTNESVFYMTKAIVVKDLFFGNWKWKSREDGNLMLQWTGGTE